MPLLVLCGLPSSGKSTRARALHEHFTGLGTMPVHVINDSNVAPNKNDIYKSSQTERAARSNLKAHVERVLTTSSLVILDSPNYIKGYRYELHCLARSLSTPYCLVYCAISQDKAAEFNRSRPPSEAYSESLLAELAMRFEEPDSRNRWDRPLFFVLPEDPLPLDGIEQALFNAKAPPPRQATIQAPVTKSNFLHELDRTTQAVCTAVLSAQAAGGGVAALAIPNSDVKLVTRSHVTLSQLSRLRRQFVNLQRLHALETPERLPTLFVTFLNSQLSAPAV